MLLSHRYRFIYLKIRKTAGTSVEVYLEPFCCTPSLYPGPAMKREALVTEDGIIGRRMNEPHPPDAFYNHMPAEEVRARVGSAVWDQYQKVSVVRNPFDRAVSWLWHGLAPKDRARLAAAPFDAVLDAFVRRLENPGKILRDAAVVSIDGRCILDSWIRYESLHADLEALSQRLGLPPAPYPLGEYRRDARVRPEPWQAYVERLDIRRRIVDMLRLEFEAFGYPTA